MATRMIETPILSPRAARRFSGVAFPCTTRGAQLVLASSPQMRSRARQNAAPGRRLPARRQGRAAVEERGVIDQILNEWCDPFISAARLNEWFTTNFGAADELTADYRAPRRRAADSGGAGRTATVSGGKRASKGCCRGGGHISPRRRRRAMHPATLREIAHARVIV